MTIAPLTPMPTVEPLELLYVTNGSPLTADRWWLAHRYYQHRQNLHYQSLHQPGIVQGLGVRSVAAPDGVASELRDDRWIEIQPGLAIDWAGNPIVVETPMTFRITANVIDQPVTVYVVLAYVNPRDKHWSGIPTDVVKEEFRINERTTPPAPEEIELCRLTLAANGASLEDARSVLHPAVHEVNLCYRQRVRSRTCSPTQVALIDSAPDSPYHKRLTALIASLDGLYPKLMGAPLCTLGLEHLAKVQDPYALPALLFLPYERAIALSETTKADLQRWIAEGCTLLVELTDRSKNRPPLSQLQMVQQELQTAIQDIDTVEAGSDLDQVRQDLIGELASVRAAMQMQLQAIAQPIQSLSPTVSSRAESEPSDCLPTQQPFLFDQLPHLPPGPIQLMAWDGVILVIGPLSAAWTKQQFDQPLPRETLRNAQELGINMLYQASRRQQLIQAQQATQQSSQLEEDRP